MSSSVAKFLEGSRGHCVKRRPNLLFKFTDLDTGGKGFNVRKEFLIIREEFQEGALEDNGGCVICFRVTEITPGITNIINEGWTEKRKKVREKVEKKSKKKSNWVD